MLRKKRVLERADRGLAYLHLADRIDGDADSPWERIRSTVVYPRAGIWVGVGVARIGICFVCSANICRSPTAEGIMKQLVEEAHLGDRFRIESAGTSSFCEGGPRNRRSESTANSRGISLEGRARQFRREDFARFTYVLAMDERNRADLIALADSAEDRAKVALLRDFDPNASETSVPDPYMGGARGFEEVFELCEAACRGLMAELLERFVDR